MDENATGFSPLWFSQPENSPLLYSLLWYSPV